MTATLSAGRYQIVLDGIHSRRFLDDCPPHILLPIKPSLTGSGAGILIVGPTEGTRYRLVGLVGDEALYESEG